MLSKKLHFCVILKFYFESTGAWGSLIIHARAFRLFKSAIAPIFVVALSKKRRHSLK
jgi:hypothetical protein